MDIAVIQLEEQIRKAVYQDNNRVAVFDYESDTSPYSLKVSTFNEDTKEITLMYETKQHKERAECLAEVVRYLEVIKPSMSLYTLRWKKKGTAGESELSYFYCNDALEVLEKFFSTRNRKEYNIFSLEQKGVA